MTDLEHDITPVMAQAIRGQAVRKLHVLYANEIAGELEARPEQLEPKGWSEHFKKQVA